MNSDLLWAAMALVLVFEGLFPFFAPKAWRETFQRLIAMQDGQIRFFGLASILLGLGLFWLVT